MILCNIVYVNDRLWLVHLAKQLCKNNKEIVYPVNLVIHQPPTYKKNCLDFALSTIFLQGGSLVSYILLNSFAIYIFIQDFTID